jgi:hypothetical protein
MPRLPKTLARIPQSCEILVSSLGNVEISNLFNIDWSTIQTNSLSVEYFATTVLLALEANTSFGSLQKVDIKLDREVDKIFSLGYNAFEPEAMAPKAISTTVTITNLLLYKQKPDIMSILGYTSGNLFFQQAPFIIKQMFRSPENWDEVTDVLIYTNCWITSLPVTFDYSAENNLIIEAATVNCGRILSLSSNLIGAIAGSTGFVKKGIKL